MKRLDALLAAALRGLCIACLLLLFGIVAVSVLNRFVGWVSMGWADELIELLFAWMLFIGAACLWRERAHFCVDLLAQRWKGTRRGALLEILVGLACIALLGVFTWQSALLSLNASDDSPVFAVSKRYWYGVMPLAGALMLVHSLRDLVATLRAWPAAAPSSPGDPSHDRLQETV